ncbi:oxidoreductase [Skermania sp. ID1734]|uniref:FAD-binding oxidoreductase n=1 Tax=Skermania sp. ID1734 TaxID=2597516 RepID=UPI0011808F78|nr:FAD-binding oxidoreductase [Skermania sp. ID1734]TSD94486.1 oxidoreductase [Skermania sp. ID1734]
MWTSTVVEHHRLRHDIAVVRLIGEVVPFRAGQSVAVAVPQHREVTRRLSPALPPSLDGKLEFHVRALPAGFVSPGIVADTKPGDVWQVGDPAGEMRIDDSGRNVIMIAGGTGLAPLRALILNVSRRRNPPNVFLFFGGRSPRELYAADMLYLLSQRFDWLTVVPVIEQLLDPKWPDKWYERVKVNFGFTVDDVLQGTLADVVGAHGAFKDSQVLVCGSPAMTRSTVDRLVATGTPKENISYDPY